MDSALPMPYVVIIDFILTDVIPGEFAVSPEPENGNKPFTFKTTGVVKDILVDEENLMRFTLVEDECKDTLNVLALNSSHRFAVGQHVQCFGYIGPVSVGKYALLLEAAEDQAPGPGQPDYIVCHPFKLKKPPGAGKKSRGKRALPGSVQVDTESQSTELAISVQASSIVIEDLSLVEKAVTLTVVGDAAASHSVECPTLESTQEDLLDLNFGEPAVERVDHTPPAVEEPDCAQLNMEERLQVLLKQNEIMMRVFAAPYYRALAAKIFRKISIYHMRAVEQLFRGKGYGEDWLTVVTSALSDSAGGEVIVVPFDAQFDAEVQRAVVDFPYTVDMDRPLDQRVIGDHDRVIYDIFQLYEQLKPYC
eukprot:gene13906-15991_t